MQQEANLDEKYAEVDAYLIERLHPSGSHLYEHIEYAKQLSAKNGLVNAEVSILQGKFLMSQCQMIDAKHVLEVGTLGGVSSTHIAPVFSAVC
jgi:predicted O-methyltransferase YrrM